MSEHSFPVILMAEDDPDDQLLTREALAEAKLLNRLDIVEDGLELMQYLKREGTYVSLKDEALPGIILLDLNMPRMDGRAALQALAREPNLKRIPVIVLTTSDSESDVLSSYDLGANSYMVKPVSFEKMTTLLKSLSDFWFKIVHLPN